MHIPLHPLARSVFLGFVTTDILQEGGASSSGSALPSLTNDAGTASYVRISFNGLLGEGVCSTRVLVFFFWLLLSCCCIFWIEIHS